MYSKNKLRCVFSVLFTQEAISSSSTARFHSWNTTDIPRSTSERTHEPHQKLDVASEPLSLYRATEAMKPPGMHQEVLRVPETQVTSRARFRKVHHVLLDGCVRSTVNLTHMSVHERLARNGQTAELTVPVVLHRKSESTPDMRLFEEKIRSKRTWIADKRRLGSLKDDNNSTALPMYWPADFLLIYKIIHGRSKVKSDGRFKLTPHLQGAGSGPIRLTLTREGY